jgi:peptide/nickel transport system permease protein
MVLPSFTLALTSAATYLVLLRSEMLQQLQLDHVQLARSKGLAPGQIVRRHAFRPAAPILVAAIGAQSGIILGYMVIVERIFLLPGFSDYVLVAIGRRDVIAIAGSLFVIAAILAVINLFADAMLLAVDPRLGR